MSGSTIGDVGDDEDYMYSRSMFLFELTTILKEYEGDKYSFFLNGVIYFGKIFQKIYDNLDIIKDPRFHTNDNFKKVTLDKIAHWNDTVAKSLMKFIVNNDDIDFPLLHSSIKHTDKMVNLIASNAYFQ